MAAGHFSIYYAIIEGKFFAYVEIIKTRILRVSFMPLVQHVAEQIKRHAMVNAGETVVVGVSGGPDSVALLHILNRLRDDLGIRLVVAHLNHRLRGAEAEADARFVRELAESLRLEAHVESRDVAVYGKEKGVSIQVAAREIRYGFLSEVAVQTGAARVALGHHADDQAETILLHFIRGTGPGGLRGMLPVRDGFFIRPLLGVRRHSIEAYCRYHNLPTRQDSSNLQLKYLRNRVRLELIPLLEKHYNPSLVDTINRLGEISREEDRYLEEQAREHYYRFKTGTSGGRVGLDRERLLSLPPALVRRVVRLAWMEISGSKDGLHFRHIDQIMEIIRGGGGYREIALPKNIVCKKHYGLVEFVLGGENEEVPFYQYRLKVPGVTAVPELGVSIEAQILPAGEAGDPALLNQKEALLDYDRLTMPLVVRRRLAGDRFQPLGLDGTVKLKKFFIDHKIPRNMRDRIPLVVSGNEIIWVAGLRPGDKWKVTDKTTTCLRLYIDDYRGNFCDKLYENRHKFFS